jgi:hypothetical protein
MKFLASFLSILKIRFSFSKINKSSSDSFEFLPFILVLSFNQPKICSTTIWNTDGITFADQTTVGIGPTDIFIDRNNTIYVINQEKKQILVWFNNSISPTKIISTSFSYLESMFVTNNGDIYISSGDSNGRVDKWISTTNTFVTVMNVNSSCWYLFIDMNNTLYCSMINHHLVVKRWLNDSVMTSTIAAGTGTNGSASNELYHPCGIFVDVNFDLYVADCTNHRIQHFQSGLSYGETIAGSKSVHPTISLSCPVGIILDADKYLFIVDQNNHRIVRSGPNGFRCLIGCYGEGSQSNQLFEPSSLSFDSSGNMFILDWNNNRIQKYNFFESCCSKFESFW